MGFSFTERLLISLVTLLEIPDGKINNHLKILSPKTLMIIKLFYS